MGASHRKAMQVHARAGQTESQLVATCGSVWPGLNVCFGLKLFTLFKELLKRFGLCTADALLCYGWRAVVVVVFFTLNRLV